MEVFYVKIIHKNYEIIWEGTLEYLKEMVFSYILEYDHFQSDKINTIESLITALNKSVDECGRCDVFFDISSKEEFDK